MANLKDIRNRIRSVTNTQKITSAMKLVAAAKLRRAQEAVVAARPYSLKMRQVLSSLASSLDEEASPLFRSPEEGTPPKILLVPIAGERGLCGAFNSSIIRRTERELRERADSSAEIAVAPIGRKAREHFSRRNYPSALPMEELLPNYGSAAVSDTVDALVRVFTEGEYDYIYLIYNEFQSALTQIVQVSTFLPLTADGLIEDVGTDDEYTKIPDLLFEPPAGQLLDLLLPKYLESQLYRALLESVASEEGARMTAMDNASRNASDLIDKLTLQMNRARQAIITTELMEITSGAEALKG